MLHQLNHYENGKPRISVQNGELVIQSALDKSIGILTTGQSSRFLVNGNNFQGSTSQSAYLVPMVQAHETKINRLIERIDQLEEENITAVANKVQQLGNKVNTLTELLTQNECNSNPCRNGGSCVDTYNGFICNCPPTWEGTTCDIDVNECARFAGTSFDVKTEQLAPILRVATRNCTCATNWYGIHCTQQYDDCSTASHQELCGHGTCIDEKRAVPGQAKYRCICDPGWQSGSSGPACIEDINECLGPVGRCSQHPQVICINLPGTFHCGPCPAVIILGPRQWDFEFGFAFAFGFKTRLLMFENQAAYPLSCTEGKRSSQANWPSGR
ncbi:cubilin [Caerostris extrusa]|uniref:Cubilin n=1 Tax=Caerostris extrusa TaxID=172846 RepID=A0AAV4Y9I0_CAEEX|nr:cubilin [Caerostris extrusa]